MRRAGSLWHKRAGASNTMNLSTNESAVYDSPVLVHFVFESDHVSLLEAELARVLRLEVVERLAGGRVQRGRGGAGRVAVGGGHAGVEARAELRRMMGRSAGRRTSRRYQVTAGDVAGNTNSQ